MSWQNFPNERTNMSREQFIKIGDIKLLQTISTTSVLNKLYRTVLQSQMALTSSLKIKQLLPFGLSQQILYAHLV